MIDHIGISVSSIARATEFYLKALAPLGYGIVIEVSAEETGQSASEVSEAARGLLSLSQRLKDDVHRFLKTLLAA